MIHFGFGTYSSPFWLLPQTLDHMTHTFHPDITAKNFIKKIKLTPRQSSTNVSSRLSLNRLPSQIPSSSTKILKRKTFLNFLLWQTFLLSICLCSAELPHGNTHIHSTTNTLKKPKFMKKFWVLVCFTAPRLRRRLKSHPWPHRVWQVVLDQKHLQAYTQESGEPGYCSALYKGLGVLA